ncbi:hypothetical protein ACO2Q7_13695 [Rathayibacter sp. KR2-224]|uniref:hypothetical protein n=1 Tax=Rathayibacter sp. KR2-224 TaxID=3400913 RepID=UPI003C115429
MRIAASLLGGATVDLSEELPSLDRKGVVLVLAAITHAAGSHEHSEMKFNNDGEPVGFTRLESLYPVAP